MVHFHCVLEIRIESSWLFNVSEARANEGCIMYVSFICWVNFGSDLIGGGLARICLSCWQLVRENQPLFSKISFLCGPQLSLSLSIFFQQNKQLCIIINTYISFLIFIYNLNHKHPNHNTKKKCKDSSIFNLQESKNSLSYKIKWEDVGSYDTSVLLPKYPWKKMEGAPLNFIFFLPFIHT